MERSIPEIWALTPQQSSATPVSFPQRQNVLLFFFNHFDRLLLSHNLLIVRAKDFPVLKTYYTIVKLS